MKNYTVYFEIYRKKMKVKILAESVSEAREKLRNKIVFHKIIMENNDLFNQATDKCNDIMDLIQGKKK